MSEPKFTPGPWDIVRDEDGRPRAIKAPREESDLCYLTRWSCFARPASSRTEANANLMASAPDLYLVVERDELLATEGYTQSVAKQMGEPFTGVFLRSGPNGLRELVCSYRRGALAKARGEQP